MQDCRRLGSFFRGQISVHLFTSRTTVVSSLIKPAGISTFYYQLPSSQQFALARLFLRGSSQVTHKFRHFHNFRTGSSWNRGCYR